jgi:hypothetical protein
VPRTQLEALRIKQTIAAQQRQMRMLEADMHQLGIPLPEIQLLGNLAKPAN